MWRWVHLLAPSRWGLHSRPALEEPGRAEWLSRLSHTAPPLPPFNTRVSTPPPPSALGLPRYKYAVQVVVGENKGQGVQMGSRCIWDPATDGQASETYANVSHDARAGGEGSAGSPSIIPIPHPPLHPSPLARYSFRRSTSSPWALCTRPTTIEQTTQITRDRAKTIHSLSHSACFLSRARRSRPGRPPAVPHAPLLTRNIPPPPFPPDAELTSPRRRWGGP
jgi:hypothetical protein